jgi:hypothetical protein
MAILIHTKKDELVSWNGKKRVQLCTNRKKKKKKKKKKDCDADLLLLRKNILKRPDDSE